MDTTIGQRLKQYRAPTKLTQEQVAERIGIPHNTYVRYETDLRKPTTENAIKLSRFYHVSLNELLYGVDSDSESKAEQPHISDDDLKFALWGGDAGEITDAQLEEVKQYAQFVRKRQRTKKRSY